MKKIIKPALILTLGVMLTNCSSSDSAYERRAEVNVAEWETDRLVSRGQSEFEQGNYTESSPYLREAAKRDDQSALYALGYMHYYGLGVNKDVNLSRDLIRRSAAFGYRPAVKALRLFVATKSIFNVNTSNVDYIASNDKKPAKETKSIKLPEKQLAQQLKLTENVRQPQPFTEFNSEPFLTEMAQNTQPKIRAEAITALPVDTKIETTQVAATPVLAPKSIEILPTDNQQVAANQPTVKTVNSLKQEQISNKKTDDTNHGAYVEPQQEPAKIAKAAVEKATTTKEIIAPLAHAPIDETFGFQDDSLLTQELRVAETSRTRPNIWLRKQNPNDYTIQITAKKSLPELNEFIAKNDLTNKVETFSYIHKNQTWYGASFGAFKKPSQAHQAMLNDLPSELQSKPWIRQFKNIQLSDKS